MNILQERLPNDSEVHSTRANLFSANSDASLCKNGTTEIQNHFDKVQTYFYPFEMEFCLSALGVLLSLTKGMNRNEKVDTENN